MAYSAQKWRIPAARPSAQKIQPVGFSGRREAIRAPTVEQLTEIKMLSTQ
jgi:hypothetical protein